MVSKVVARLPFALIALQDLAFLRGIIAAADAGEVIIPSFLTAELQGLVGRGVCYVHPRVKEARSARSVVRSLNAHRLRVQALVIAKSNFTALIRADGIESDELIGIARLLESEERVLPYGHAVVFVRQFFLQSDLREQFVVESRSTHLVALRGGCHILLGCPALNLQMHATLGATIQVSFLSREGGHDVIYATEGIMPVGIEPLAGVANLTTEIPAEIFLGGSTLAIDRYVGDLHVPFVMLRIFEICRALHGSLVEVRRDICRLILRFQDEAVILVTHQRILDGVGHDIVLLADSLAVELHTVDDGIEHIRLHFRSFQGAVIDTHHVEVGVRRALAQL